MRKSLLLIAVLGAFASPVMAEEAKAVEATPDFTFVNSASFVSDYIFRGQSQTWGRPAAQVSIELDHKSGLYAGFFGSNVSDKWLPGANLETDLYAGYRSTIGSTEIGYDVGGIYYMYPGANWSESVYTGSNKSNSLNTFEAYAALSYKWFSVKSGITATEYWGWSKNNSAPASEPSNDNVGDFNGDGHAGVKGSTKGSYYLEANAAYEVLPTWTVSGQLGHQVVNNSIGLDLTYYKAGVSKALPQGWSVAAYYSGTNEPDAYKNFTSLMNGPTTGSKSDIAKDKVFFSVSKSF